MQETNRTKRRTETVSTGNETQFYGHVMFKDENPIINYLNIDK